MSEQIISECNRLLNENNLDELSLREQIIIRLLANYTAKAEANARGFTNDRVNQIFKQLNKKIEEQADKIQPLLE